MRWWPFSGKTVPAGRGRFLATNAPNEWPGVPTPTLQPTGDDASGEISRKNEMAIASAIQDVLIPYFETRGWSAMPWNAYLTDDGAIEVAVRLVDDKRQIFWLVGFPDATSATADRFEGISNYVVPDRRLIWYAPRPLPPSTGRLRLQLARLEFSHFKHVTRPRPSGHYAFWWSTPGEEFFLGSKVFRAMERAHRALDGIYSYVFPSFLRETWILRDAPPRMTLPERDETFHLIGPNEVLCVLLASEKAGLQLLMRPETTLAEHRDRLWNAFADLAERYRRDFDQANGDIDPPDQRKALEHWNVHVELARKAKETGQKVASVGIGINAQAESGS